MVEFTFKEARYIQGCSDKLDSLNDQSFYRGILACSYSTTKDWKKMLDEEFNPNLGLYNCYGIDDFVEMLLTFNRRYNSKK